MRTFRLSVSFISLIIVLGVLLWSGHAFAGNIDPDNNGSAYAYGENVGWINLNPTGGGVTVTDSELNGFAWGENVGWIILNCSSTNTCLDVSYSVTNDGAGNLSGYAWGENVGWINFAPAGGGVKINPVTGVFSGKAWGENIGWISYNATSPVLFQVKTSWRGNQTPVDNSLFVTGPVSGNQQTQTVAWNYMEREYMVLWQDFRNGSANPDIYGARLDKDGNMVSGDLPIIVQTAKQAGPWVSYGGGGYMAVWIDQRNMSTTGTDVYGAWILTDGTVSSEFVVTNATANQRAASVFYNPSANNFLVTWTDDSNGASDVNIWGAVINPEGIISSGPFAMVTATGNQRGPYVRYDYENNNGNNNYFMVWFDNRSGNFDIYGSRVSSAGSLLDGSGLVISNATGDQKNPRLTDRDSKSGLGNFVLSWIDLRNGQADIYGALIDGVGTKAGSDIQIAGGSYDQRAASIDVDYIRTGQAVVSWIDKRNGTDFDIYRAQVDQSGVVSGETLVSGAGIGAVNNQVGPLVIYSDDYGTDNGFLIIWRDNRSGVDYDLYGNKAWP